MTRSIFSKEYDRFRELLIEAREAAGLSQYDVAERLQRPQSFVSKYERGERRLDVIEFIEVCESLEVHPFDVLKGLSTVVGENDPVIAGDDILNTWEITPRELTTLVAENPSLRGMMLGYVAELKFQKMWLDNPDVTSFFKHDDHDRLGKGDKVITYKGEEFIIEVKSLQTNSIKRLDDKLVGKAQVDASDRRNLVFPDGSTLETTLLLKGQFHLLAVNIYAFTNEWRFIFAKNKDLPSSTAKKYTEVQRSMLIKSLIDVSWPPQTPFTTNPYDLLEELYQERVNEIASSQPSDLREP